MKKPNLHTYVLAGLLCFSGTLKADTNLVDSVLAEAKFRGNASDAKAELQRALTEAVLVVTASVVNSNAAVMVSTNQHEVSTGQGWSAIIIRPQAVLQGKWDNRDIITTSDWGPSERYGSGIQFPPRASFSFTNGETCVFFLKADEKLSRWCMTNVFREFRCVPIK